MKTISKMELSMIIIHFMTVFLMFSSFCTVFSYPSRPLNERSTELAWQAWLLVDDQNQSKQSDPDLTRRKVIAKSVFIAPTFNPEKLPACAEGYISDTMGRCVKIIALDQNASLEFLLQKIMGNSGGLGEVKPAESVSTPGPIQFNIPFVEDTQNENDNMNNNSNFAIVVAQTSNENHVKMAEANTTTSGQNHENGQNISFMPSNGNLEPVKVHTKHREKHPDDMVTTTMEAETTTDLTTEQVYSTVSDSGDETTYVNMITETEPTETLLYSEIPEDQQALFFKLPLKTHHLESSTITPITTETVTVTSRVKFDDEIDVKFGDETINNDEPIIEDGTNVNNINSKKLFKGIINGDESSNTNLFTPENVRHITNKIRFPNENSEIMEHSENSNVHLSRINYHPGNHFKRPQRQNNKPNADLHHSHIRDSDLSVSDTKHHNQHLHGQPTEHLSFSHRNRDKNFWNLPSTWSESSPQRALVLRFSSRSGNTNNFAQSHFYSRYAKATDPMYRQFPIEDLSFIFGHKRKYSDHR